MFSPWILNVLLIVGIAFSVNRTVQRDNAIRAFTEDFGISDVAANTLIDALPNSTLREIVNEKTFAGANLEGVDLTYIDLSGANLSGIRLKDANLFAANFTGSNLNEADLRGAYLHNAVFDGASLQEARLQEAQLEEASLYGARMEDVSLWNAYAARADFREANIWDGYLVGGNFRGASFDSTVLTRAYLHGTDFTDSNLSTAYFDGTYYNGETIFPSGMEPWGYYGLREGELSSDDFFWENADNHFSDYMNGSSMEPLINFLRAAPAYHADSFITRYEGFGYTIPEELYKETDERVR